MSVTTLDLPRTYRYQPSRDDWAAFERLPREIGWPDRILFLACLASVMPLAIALEARFDASLPFTANSTPRALLMAASAAAVAVALARAVLSVWGRWRIRRRARATGDTILNADVDSFALVENGSTRRLAWAEIARVILVPSHLFLCTSPREAVIVPRRAFASDGEMRALAQHAERAGRDD